MRGLLLGSAVALSLVVAGRATADIGPTTYYVMNGATITELGSLGEPSVGLDINNAGKIVGHSTNASGQKHAFYLSNGVMTEILLGGWIHSSEAIGINNQNEVVGEYFVTGPETLIGTPFRWKPVGGPTSLSLFPWTVPIGYPTAINDAGVVVGASYGHASTSSGSCSGLIPALWPQSTITPHRCPNWYGYLRDINNAGSVIGSTASGDPEIFRYIGGVAASQPVPPLIAGLVVKAPGMAEGTNEHNNMVGYHYYRNPNASNPSAPIYRAFYWNGTSAQTTVLPMLAGGRFSKAHDVNEQRMVVGVAEANPQGFGYYERAYIWHADFGLKLLPGLPQPPNIIQYGNCVAHAVNDRKDTNLVQATGSCRVGSETRAVRWDIDVSKYTSY